jgi:hypothetical protein
MRIRGRARQVPANILKCLFITVTNARPDLPALRFSAGAARLRGAGHAACDTFDVSPYKVLQ